MNLFDCGVDYFIIPIDVLKLSSKTSVLLALDFYKGNPVFTSVGKLQPTSYRAKQLSSIKQEFIEKGLLIEGTDGPSRVDLGITSNPEAASMRVVLPRRFNYAALSLTELRVLRGRDDELFVTPELLRASMPTVEAEKFNAEQAAEFVRTNPDYEAYRSDETLHAIMDYFSRNGVRIFDAAMIRGAFTRLRDYGVIQKRPVPKVEPEPRPQPTRVNLTIERKQPEPVKPSGPKTYMGRDWETGKEREFTEREVNRMSSKEYARAFPVAPTFAELLTAMRTEEAR